ncbi:DUF5947 family protein, partial [Streptomyces sp. NPDC057540]|uniref:DUF5947 family protein n=1 Tax=Streptomyces sp. NPDC057540 TaxID=3346160 RepID=UPI003681FD94
MNGPPNSAVRPPGPTGLRRFTTPRPPREERCELCGAPLAAEARHPHLVDTDKRALVCACGPCAQLMDRSAASPGRFRAVAGRRERPPRPPADAPRPVGAGGAPPPARGWDNNPP